MFRVCMCLCVCVFHSAVTLKTKDRFFLCFPKESCNTSEESANSTLPWGLSSAVPSPGGISSPSNDSEGGGCLRAGSLLPPGEPEQPWLVSGSGFSVVWGCVWGGFIAQEERVRERRSSHGGACTQTNLLFSGDVGEREFGAQEGAC